MLLSASPRTLIRPAALNRCSRTCQEGHHAQMDKYNRREVCGMGRYPIPVAILARLAVSLTDQGRGIGIGLRKDAIRHTLLAADQVGFDPD